MGSIVLFQSSEICPNYCLNWMRCLRNELFCQATQRTPDDIAVVTNNASIIFEQLDSLTDQMATLFQQDKIVGICIDHSMR